MLRFVVIALASAFIGSCVLAPKSLDSSILKLPRVERLDDTHLTPILTQIGSNRVVMLGESIHLTKEFSQIRNYFVRNLHRRGQFNQLFFEGSPIEFWIANDEFLNSVKDGASVSRFQKTALFGLWQTKEIFSLLNYALIESHHHSSGLYVSSYDVQIGQGYGFGPEQRQVFIEFLNRLEARGLALRPLEKQKILTLNKLTLCGKKNFPKSKKEYDNAMDAIRLLDAVLQKTKKDDAANATLHHNMLLFIPRSLEYSLGFCRDAHLGSRSYTEARDDWGARQFSAILKNSSEKAIVWAHSGHVREGVSKNGHKAFGAYLRNFLPQSVFSVHFTAKDGFAVSFLNKTGDETKPSKKRLLSIENVSLEQKLSQLSSKDFFFVPKNATRRLLNDQETTRREPDFFSVINPYEDFDAYYFVQEVTAPKLLIP